MGQKKFDQIDGLRFFAVFGVVCVHWHWAGSNLCDLITSGSRGVDLFFVISGFLITLGLIRSKEKEQTLGTSLYKFYIRRFLRIFPIYYLTVFILFLVWHAQMRDSIWWYLLYLSNFYSIRIHDWGVAGHFWSLSVEEQFYMVWPFIILFVPVRRLPLVIISSVLISLIAKSYWVLTGAPFWSAYMNPLSALDTLALGALLAYLYHFHQDRLRQVLYNPAFFVLLTIQMIAFVYIRKAPPISFIHDIGIRTSFGLFSMWLIGRATFGFSGLAGYILDSSPLRYIGKISYGIYLYHPFVPMILERIKLPGGDNIHFIIYAFTTVALASISWYVYESPILKLKKRFE